MTETREQLIRLLVKDKIQEFHALCRDLPPEAMDLSGATFKNLHLSGADLSGFNLANTEWQDCHLTDLTFLESDLTGAYFHGCALVECRLTQAILQGTSMEGCVLRSVTIHACDLTETDLQNTQLQECHLGEGTWADLSWNGLRFDGGSLRDVPQASGEWRSIVFKDATLAALDLTALDMARCFHQSCTFDNALLPEEGIAERVGRRRTV